MSDQPLFRVSVDEAGLTDAMFEFITDPRPTRNERPVVQALSDMHPDSVDVMEAMALDGTDDRADVAAYVHFVFGNGTPLPVR